MRRNGGTNQINHGVNRGVNRMVNRVMIPLPSSSYLMAIATILVGLILFIGFYSVERTEKTLLSFLEKSCVASAGILERIAQENLNVMMQESAHNAQSRFVPFGEEVFSPEKLLVATIGKKAKEIDIFFSGKHPSTATINDYAKNNNLRMVILLDGEGKTTFQSVPMPREFFGTGKTRLPYQQEASLKLLDDLAKQKIVSFIALQRQDKSGTIIVVLDNAGSRYWGMVVAVGKAVRDLQHGRGFEYVRVFDDENRLLAFAGDMGNQSAPFEKENINKILQSGSAAIPQRFNIGEEKMVGMMLPLNLNNKRAGVINIGISRSVADKILADNKRNVFVSVLIVILITIIALFIFNRNQRIYITKKLEMERQLEKAQRLSSLGKLAAGVAHEIRNPLNAISMATQRIKRDFIPNEDGRREDFNDITSVIRDEIRRLDSIIEEFLVFSRTRRLDIHPYVLSEIIQKLVSLLSEQAREKGVEIQTFLEDNLMVPLDADKFQQAMLNIVKNAMESISSDGGKIEIRAQKTNGRVRIVVSDTGCGMSAGEIEKIFNPEYTTKEKGLGLGLTLSYEIIKGHNGYINVASQENVGTTFEVFLPLQQNGEEK